MYVIYHIHYIYVASMFGIPFFLDGWPAHSWELVFDHGADDAPMKLVDQKKVTTSMGSRNARWAVVLKRSTGVVFFYYS